MMPLIIESFLFIKYWAGLEPAAPLFVGRNYPEDTHLDASDAEFVDIIHTNGQPLWLGGQGAFVDTGHVDFYPNGGLAQPGCRNLFIGAILDLFSESNNYSQKSFEVDEIF